MTRVKICGLRRMDDALVAVDAGAAMLGFVFAQSRRRIEPEAAAEIIARVQRESDAAIVGVFANATPEEIGRIAAVCDLDYIQLSGEEESEILTALPASVIKTIHVNPDSTPHGLSERCAAWTGAEIVHLDTARAGSFGGTGAVFDWRVVPPLDRPILLAGGLDPANVVEAIRTVRPWGVDVSSGIETNGQKDQVKIREFLQAASSHA